MRARGILDKNNLPRHDLVERGLFEVKTGQAELRRDTGNRVGPHVFERPDGRRQGRPGRREEHVTWDCAKN